jgi:hypothetical protein
MSPHFPTIRAGSGAPGARKKPVKKKATPTGGAPSVVTPSTGALPPGDRRDFKIGEHGTVTLFAEVAWLQLPTETFTKLRGVIDTLEGLDTTDVNAAVEDTDDETDIDGEADAEQ